MCQALGAGAPPAPPPDIDPHRVAYTTVEAIGGLAWEVTFRESSAAAVPALVRLLKAGMGMGGNSFSGGGGGLSAGAKEEERKQCWAGRAWQILSAPSSNASWTLVS